MYDAIIEMLKRAELTPSRNLLKIWKMKTDTFITGTPVSKGDDDLKLLLQLRLKILILFHTFTLFIVRITREFKNSVTWER